MNRYLNTAQVVLIYGRHNDGWIRCAVTMGPTLYVIEQLPMLPYFKRVYMYDLDDTDLRHENPNERNITCSNRRPLELNGLVGRAEFLDPAHTPTLSMS